MKKSTIFLTAAVVIALGFAGVFYRITAEKQRMTDASYEKALGVLTSSAHKIEDSLRSLEDGDREKLTSTVSMACGQAVTAISHLPLAEYDTLLLEAYFNRTADFVTVLASGEDGLIAQTDELEDYAARISGELDGALRSLRQRKSEFKDVVTPTEKTSGFKVIKRELGDLGQELTDAVNAIESVPQLEYDGKYRAAGEPITTELSEVSENEAVTAAGEGWSIVGETDGNIPSYILQKDRSTMWVTKNGGRVMRIVNEDTLCDGETSGGDVENGAAEFLGTLGYTETVTVTAETVGERIKVTAAGESDLSGGKIIFEYCACCGKLLAFDAYDYLCG